MSGHSKWNNIKHKKAKGDAYKGKIFTKIGREIAVAVKLGGSDPLTNSKLFDLVAKARANNMPNDNIARSIKKAAGELGNINYEPFMYEGYGVGGSAVLVETLSDNKNRTGGDVRCAFDKNGGSLGTSNCVSFMFDHMGIITVERTADLNEDKIFELAIEAGSDNVEIEDDVFTLTCQMSEYSAVRDYVVNNKYNVLQTGLEWIPNTTVTLSDDNITKFMNMLNQLEDNDDVQEVFHNVDLPVED